MLPLDLYARVRVFSAQIAHETAGAARTRSSLRPLNSRRVNEVQTSGAMRRENANTHSLVVTREGG